MNYLTEIKLFYDWLETHELTPSAILLWHGLMFIANRAGWETEMTVPMRRLEGVTYMTVASIYRARKVLVDAGENESVTLVDIDLSENERVRQQLPLLSARRPSLYGMKE